MKSLLISLFLLIHFFELNAQFVTSSDSVLNKFPVVFISGPSNGTTFTAPASFSLNAIATDEDGSIAKVEFFNGSILLGSTATSPYSFNWLNVPEGIYRVSAKATDNRGESTSSAVVTLIVTRIVVNQLPTVVLTTPVNNSTANAPANITMSAEAIDADGFITRVEFYNESLLLGVDYTAPYNYVWNGAGAGIYHITAKAIDNQGSSKFSTAATITLLSVITDVCSGLMLYTENGGYIAGSKVKNSNARYECKTWPYSGWCNGAAWAYAPGEGAYWTDAWKFIGSCNSNPVNQPIQGNAPELSVVPNPVVSTAILHFDLKESDQVSLQLCDRYSQCLQTIVDGNLEAGTYEFYLNMEDLQKGTYFLKSITHKESRVTRIEKTE